MTDKERLEAIINHVFLPSKLPDGQDELSCESALLTLVANALGGFAGVADERTSSTALRAQKAIERLQNITDGCESIKEDILASAFQDFANTDGVLPVYVKEQNAALILENDGSGSIIFDTFEIAPDNASVMSCHGRLRRIFPAASVSLPVATLQSDDFRSALAESLAKMSIEKVPSMYDKTKKAGSMVDETRNTINPSIVTSLLFTFLLAHGKPAERQAITKHTQDEVCLAAGHELPWRRSPVWLLTRVLLQRMFWRSDVECSDSCYKSFMIFFMSGILELSVQHGIFSDLLHIMTAKINQRQLKLRPRGDEPWLTTALERARRAVKEMGRRWNKIQETENASFVGYKDQSHDPNLATNISLPTLDRFIECLRSRSPSKASLSTFKPHFRFQPSCPEIVPTSSTLGSLKGSERLHCLFAIETWVDEHLEDWLRENIMAANTCQVLCELTENYHEQANQAYKCTPEALSIMHLTVLSIWIACDRAAVRKFQLLSKYSPQIPSDFWQVLHARTKRQLQRIDQAERYLISRTGLPVFSTFNDPNSFAVKYFDLSSEHQALRTEIEESARKARDRKREELRAEKSRYSDKVATYEEMSCGTFTFRNGRTVHDRYCERCRIEQEAAGMKIKIHEWPLPKSSLSAKATVFELCLPSEYSAWRDQTLYLHTRVLPYSHSAAKWSGEKHTLQGYSGLSSYYKAPARQNMISLASHTKPWVITHMKSVKVSSATESQILRENGLTWSLHDKQMDEKFDRFVLDGKAYKNLVFPLPSTLSSQQKFLHRFPSQSRGYAQVNGIIAAQSACPQDMSLDEFKDIFALPQGFHIVWSNLLRQLAMPSIDWKRPSTIRVVWQAVNQIGPRGSEWFRVIHENLQDLRFVSQLLQYLHVSLTRVKHNWDASLAIAVFSSIATHLLSTGSSECSDQCCQFLEECRKVCISWLKTLREKAFVATDEAERTLWLDKQHELALILSNCFPVDEPDLKRVFIDSQALADFLEASIVIQQTWTISGPITTIVDNLRMRWRRAMHYLRGIIGYCFGDAGHGGTAAGSLALRGCHAQGFDIAICRLWSAFPRATATQWTSIGNCFLTSSVVASDGEEKIKLHINLLSAELLVNGVPLGRLPSHYEDHSSYALLFGRSRLDCGPSCELGMEFQAGLSYLGYEIHLAMRSADHGEKDLMVMGRSETSVRHLVPARLFRGRLPSYYVDGFVHWYVANNDSLLLKPKEEPWGASQDEFVFRRNGKCWILTQNKSRALINPRSKLGEQLATIFEPLETKLGLHIWCSAPSRLIRIEIPRLRLDFHLSLGSEHIESVQYAGMCVSTDTVETLTGLRSRLLLKSLEDPDRRLILIPEGHVGLSRTVCGGNASHVQVVVSRQATRIQAYNLRKNLGILEGSGSVQSKLYLAYLHALTSHPLPDAFTSHTGVEQALGILRSEGLRSFTVLSAENISMLETLTGLSPKREYYPSHLKVQQRAVWSSELCSSTQHECLAYEVERIFAQARDSVYLYPGMASKIPGTSSTLNDLCRRGAMRSSTFRSSGYGAEDFSKEQDAGYLGRVTLQSPGMNRVFATCTALMNNEIPAFTPETQCFSAKLREFFGNATKILGPSHPIELVDLQYGEKWLHAPLEVFAKCFCRIHDTLRKKFDQMNDVRTRLWICSMAFFDEMEPIIIQALVVLVSSQRSRSITIPQARDFEPVYGRVFVEHRLRSSLSGAKKPFDACPESDWPSLPGEDPDDKEERLEKAYRETSELAMLEWLLVFAGQWPCKPAAVKQPTDYHAYFETSNAMNCTRLLWQRWYDNLMFDAYLVSIGDVMKSMDAAPTGNTESCGLPSIASCHREARAIDLNSVLALLSPPAIQETNADSSLRNFMGQADGQVLANLRSFLMIMRQKCTSEVELRYISSLEDSASSLYKQSPPKALVGNRRDLSLAISDYSAQADKKVNIQRPEILQLLERQLGVKTNNNQGELKGLQFALSVRQAPRWSTRVLLTQLNHKYTCHLSGVWKAFLLQYAQDIERQQWSRRLWMVRNREGELLKELANEGCREWDRTVHVDTLLLEIEANIRVREVQGEIASLMRNPPENTNAVMQLNMGEGKSSVIVPIVASSLAGVGNESFVRVTVAKPQSKQMMDMLLSAIGGIIDRRIHHLPFSRTIQISLSQAQRLHEECERCISTGGVMLLQPEHILSLQHMTIESAMKGQHKLSRQLLKTWRLIHTKGRDLIDESDENFSPKRELVYTIGKQQPIDFAPKRWAVTQKILDMIPSIASDIQKRLPDSIEVQKVARGRFPRVRLLDEVGKEQFIDALITQLFNVGIASFPVARQSSQLREMIKKYVTSPSLTRGDIEAVEGSVFWGPMTEETIYLLRGLFAKGILAFAFASKRWRVNYGLNQSRVPPTNLAVPYTAKDIPSERSEFSHPDVQIILTCVSYYYPGLSDDELFMTLRHLQKSDQAAEEYQSWTSTAAQFPPEYVHLKGVNLKDETQCRQEIFPHLRYLKATIDYYLSQLVFPKEMRVFPWKLSASGWDLAAAKHQPLAGFSGTNDSQHLLPLTVTQLDLDSQRHTNALVLEYLLRDENSVTMMPSQKDFPNNYGKAFLKRVSEMKPETRVILDVGAQIIDLTNEQVAEAWLAIAGDREDVQGVVFCDSQDQLCVLDRQGRIEDLSVSPFRGKLGVCLVFLDEAHTRGIDLGLPAHYRAAVTLGSNVTKDRLAQACMRMRQLGKGQTVVFCVPNEIEVKIRESRLIADRGRIIEVSDVLKWAIGETLSDLKRLIALWGNQGKAYYEHEAIWADVISKDTSRINKDDARKFLSDDAPSLETRYRPGPTAGTQSKDRSSDGHSQPLEQIVKRCADFDIQPFESHNLQEEQERELEPEAEQERQIERPPVASPCPHRLHQDVRDFVRTGIIKEDSEAFQWAFTSLKRTSAAAKLNVKSFPPGLRVTADFSKTVVREQLDVNMDSFQRDVRWILTASGSDIVKTMVVISPFEADSLTNDIKASKTVKLHIYSPRQSQGVKPIDHLQLYVVPPPQRDEVVPRIPDRLITELNIFAGQLYFGSFQDYVRTCEYLNLSWKATEDGVVVQADGFIKPEDRPDSAGATVGFRKSPVSFLSVFMAKIRKNCAEIEKTQMGQVLEGGLLTNDNFVDDDDEIDEKDMEGLTLEDFR